VSDYLPTWTPTEEAECGAYLLILALQKLVDKSLEVSASGMLELFECLFVDLGSAGK
jgi:hypothetical protein